MASFQYTARGLDGKIVAGVTEATSSSMAAKILRDQGLVPTMIADGSAAATGNVQVKGKSGRIRLDDLVIFSRQFATMIRAGLPLIEVLDILAEQCEKVTMKKVLKQIEKDVEGGASLTEAMLKHPRVFNTFFVSMVRSGEASGMLESILDQVAGYLEKIASIQRKIITAVVYPITVAVIAFLITTGLLAFVVPIFMDIFKELKGNLPLPTKFIVFLSDTIRQRWYVVGGILIVAVYCFLLWRKTEKGKIMLDRLKLKLPVFGPLFLKVAIARFTRTLGTLLRSGVNILTALEIVASTSGNAILEDAIQKTRLSIQSGESFSKPLVQSGVFPPMVTRMIDVGERTGGLEQMLSKIADFYEDQVDATVAALTSLIEPLLIVGLGAIVGFIVIAMYLPIFTMVKQIK